MNEHKELRLPDILGAGKDAVHLMRALPEIRGNLQALVGHVNESAIDLQKASISVSVVCADIASIADLLQRAEEGK